MLPTLWYLESDFLLYQHMFGTENVEHERASYDSLILSLFLSLGSAGYRNVVPALLTIALGS